MGYYVNIQESTLTVPADMVEAADEALRELNRHDDLKGGGSMTQKWFAWMPENYDDRSVCPDLRSILERLGFFVEDTDDEGSIQIVGYDNKTGDEETFLRALAPFVPEGQYVVWRGEEGEIWRDLFTGGQMVQQEGHVSFD